jgi:hypothetical protein
VTIPSGAAKFDLILVNGNGQPYVYEGTPSTDPVFPDPPVDSTVLAAVYCRSTTNIGDYVIDKRKFLQPALLTKVASDADLIRNFNEPPVRPGDPPLDYYRVRGDGTTVWGNDTTLRRDGEARLAVDDSLTVKATLSAATVGADQIAAKGLVTGRNLRSVSGGSTSETASLGDFLQDPSDGRAFIGNKNPDGSLQWDEIATFGHMLPVGTIITCLETPTRMAQTGWLVMDGTQEVNEAIQAHSRLFQLSALTYLHSGVSPNRKMVLPDLTKRFLMVDGANAGKTGPKISGVGNRTASSIVLSKAQLAPHVHSDLIGKTADFTPTGSVATGLADDIHSHPVDDDGHDHPVAIIYVAGGFTTPQGRSGEVGVYTAKATGRANTTTGEERAAVIIKDYKHKHAATSVLTMNKILGHTHTPTLDEVGDGAAIDITPNFFAVYAYIRS